MSLVYITHHNENIANIEKYMQFNSLKLPKYSSKFKRTVHVEAKKPHILHLKDGELLITSSNKYDNKSMGYAETPLNPPCKFLRKNQGLKWRREREHVCLKTQDMPPVPRFDRSKTAPKPKPRNFIAINRVYLSTSTPRHKPLRYVDTPFGDTHKLLDTGLVPQYICRRTFGKVPCYLKVHKNNMEKMRKECEDQIEKQTRLCAPLLSKTGIRKMTTEERQSILAGLKTNFAAVYKAYQSLPLYTDTCAKQLRKGQLEQDLRQLEQDMFLIESNPVIYISDF